MKKEIDIRALVITGLKHELENNISINSLLENNRLHSRQFNNHYTWTRKKATYFIESLILGCEVHPLILFKNDDNYLVCDGWNRYCAIQQFVNNDFSLDAKGLTKLTWLTGKKFKDFADDEQDYFLKNIYINSVIYYFKADNLPDKKLDYLEEEAIQKLLYVRYNSGLKLAIEELQKAQFLGEYLTETFRDKLNNDEDYKNTLKKLYIGNSRKKTNEVDCILVEIRHLIASTYANIRSYCYCKDKAQRINIFYEERLCGKSDLEKKIMFDNFNFCIDVLKKLFDMSEWKKNTSLHNKYFIQALYWALSVIKRDDLMSLARIDLRTLVEYFGAKELENKSFSTVAAHRTKPMIERYHEMSAYFKKYYGLDLYKEFSKPELIINKMSKGQKINSRGIRFRVEPIKVSVKTMLENVSSFKYNVRPSYQRYEVMKLGPSSRIIESMLLDILIPPILIYERVIGENPVVEVFDGQQRLLAIIGFLNGTYMNENGETCKSKKDGFALQGLEIYYNYNDRTFNEQKKHKLLAEAEREKLLNTKLLVVSLGRDSDIDAREQFVRLNSNITSLKNNFLYWNAIADNDLLQKTFSISEKDYSKVLGKNNINFINEQYIISLACLVSKYNQREDFSLKNSLPATTITAWLQDFNHYKQKCFNPQVKDYNESMIEIERQNYMASFELVEQFLNKIMNWLEFIEKDIHEIFCIKKSSRISLKSLIFLTQLLYHLSLYDMKQNSKQLIKILTEFYERIHEKGVERLDEISLLKQALEKINLLDSQIANRAYNKMIHTI